MSVRVELIRHIPSLKLLPTTVLEEFAAICVLRTVDVHTELESGNGEDGRMFLLLSGKLQVHQVVDGRKAVVQVLRTGDFFGDFSFIHPPRMKNEAVFEAQEPTRVCAFSNRDISTLMQRYPQFAMVLLVVLRDRLHQAESKIRDLAFASAETRVLNELIRYALRYGDERDGSYAIKERITHQGLADMTGLTRETVTKTLQFLERHGFISSTTDRLLILHSGKIEKDCVGCLKMQEG